jgi:BirA family transcriptional regulator, biotin operon repressor / biotin---[acetyl-CoA-carboxylase] ligase
VASLLDPALLPPLLCGEAVYFNVDCVEEVGSTNDELSRRVSVDSLPSGSVLVADRQTAGRGRQGRVWTSDPHSSLTFSLYWRFNVPPQQMSGLSLAVGLSLYRALNSLGAADVALKWPNDVLCQRANGEWAKLAGVLIELSPGKKGVDAIIGIGLNLFPVTLPEVGGSDTAMQPAHLAEVMLLAPERHEVLAAILRNIRSVFQVFKVSGLSNLKAEWEKAHAWQGTRVSVQDKTSNQKTEVCAGVCVGIDGDGALLIQTNHGTERVLAGDVSLREIRTMADPAGLGSMAYPDNVLCLDAGNTRLKWGLTRSKGIGNSWLKTGVCSYDDLSDLEQSLVGMPSVVSAWASNVAGAAVETQLQNFLNSKGIKFSRVTSTDRVLGVENGYALPESLGSDRWCALVAAWQREKSPCLVVSLGTATTIDALDEHGRFCGGMILPGITLMRQGLAERTAQLPVVGGEGLINQMGWPTGTDEAILIGSLEATAGAIERAWSKLAKQLNTSPRCLITGGAANDVVPRLAVKVLICEHLVLEGVRRLADSSPEH